MSYEQQYLELCKVVLENGKWIKNKRTGRECLTIPEWTFYYGDQIPLLTTKRSFPYSAFAEILGYHRRYQWADDFARIGTSTWFRNANETQQWLDNPNRLGENHCGVIYGAALEDNEINNLFTNLHNHDDNRGLMLNFWRPDKFHLGCIRPCLYGWNYTIIDDEVSVTANQRSCDLGLGGNFNSLQVWFMREYVSHCIGLNKGITKHNITNIHIYDTHIEGIEEQLSRTPTPLDVKFEITNTKTLWDLLDEERHAKSYFSLTGYEPQGKIELDLVP